MITLKLDARQQQALGAILDMALRGAGLNAHEAVGIIMQAMGEAKQAADEQAKSNVVPMVAAE